MSSQNYSIGSGSLANVTGTGNAAFGHQAGKNITTGSNNVLFGTQIATQLDSGSNNIFIGGTIATQLGDVSSGSGNVFIGTGAGDGSGNLSNQLIVRSAGTNLITGNFSTNSATFAGTTSTAGALSAATVAATTSMTIAGSNVVSFTRDQVRYTRPLFQNTTQVAIQGLRFAINKTGGVVVMNQDTDVVFTAFDAAPAPIRAPNNTIVLAPTKDSIFMIPVRVAGVVTIGQIEVTNLGAVNIFAGLNGDPFPAAANNGIQKFVIVWDT